VQGIGELSRCIKPTSHVGPEEGARLRWHRVSFGDLHGWTRQGDKVRLRSRCEATTGGDIALPRHPLLVVNSIRQLLILVLFVICAVSTIYTLGI